MGMYGRFVTLEKYIQGILEANKSNKTVISKEEGASINLEDACVWVLTYAAKAELKTALEHLDINEKTLQGIAGRHFLQQCETIVERFLALDPNQRTAVKHEYAANMHKKAKECEIYFVTQKELQLVLKPFFNAEY